jgi:hypothetical protein
MRWASNLVGRDAVLRVRVEFPVAYARQRIPTGEFSQLPGAGLRRLHLNLGSRPR